MAEYRLEVRPYHRAFVQPLPTHHGLWTSRTGVILRLTDEQGQVGWGEIAPLSWFGSETLEQALGFCQQLPQVISTAMIFAIPAHLPACQFGFETAWEALNSPPDESLTDALPECGLLPTGAAALTAWESLWQQGYRTLKWKIGVGPCEAELRIFQALVATLPAGMQLRLDANGGLDWDSAQVWLRQCDRFGIEFLEQPLPISQFEAMLALSQPFATPLALDESVATLPQLQTCYQRGWRGIFVIKPAIAGSPRQLRQFCQTHELDLVFSSVFETAIARQMVGKLARQLTRQPRAAGFGITHWFSDDLEQWAAADFEQLWHRL